MDNALQPIYLPNSVLVDAEEQILTMLQLGQGRPVFYLHFKDFFNNTKSVKNLPSPRVTFADSSFLFCTLHRAETYVFPCKNNTATLTPGLSTL